jgi:hypothetical protein
MKGNHAMKQGMTLQELAAEVERQKSVSRDFVAETTYLETRPRLELVTVDDAGATLPEPRHEIVPGALDLNIEGIGNGAFEVNKLAHSQIAAKTPIKADYYKYMLANAPALLAHNVNHWFREEPEPRMVRTLDDRVRAFLSNAYRPIGNADLIDAILPPLMEAVGPTGLQFESSALTESKMYLKAFIPSREVEIRTARVNEVIRIGFIIGNSEVGCGSVYAQPMVIVLSCTNGMQFNRFAQRVRHVGRRVSSDEQVRELYSADTLEADDKALILKTRDVALAALDEAKAATITETILDATKSKEIEGDVPQAVEEIGDRVGGFTKAEQSGILSHLASGGDLTKWGVAQAVTRYSQDVESYDRADELEQAGGEVIELPTTAWNTIATAKAA